MSSPAPGSPEWQAALDREIARHDKAASESGNDNQTFEIAPRGK